MLSVLCMHVGQSAANWTVPVLPVKLLVGVVASVLHTALV